MFAAFGLAMGGCGDGGPVHGHTKPEAWAPPRKPAEPLPALAEAGKLPFTLPPGYTAERVAGPPQIKYPMFACFDDQGRLYVAGSAGEEAPPAVRRSAPPDTIRRLEDTDGDGRFDRSIVFADKLTYPQGILWYEGAVFTASPPSLWRLEDTDGDGVADKRRELVTGFPFTGIADDMHGPCVGPDGRIYWGVGRFPYEIQTPDGPIIRKGSAPLIMRCRPDGEEIEVFCDAMGNPVETAFTPSGEPLACGTFLAPDSMGQGLRDAIIHCVLGGVYSVRDRNFKEDKRTGDLLPPVSQLGVAAGSGLVRPRGGDFGDDEALTLFSAQFNMHGVFRHRLARQGATFKAKDESFLSSGEPDFHPTDVLEDADGSLLVVDTGAWFRSCPTSQIGMPNVFGAIYRVRREGAKPPKDPRGLAMKWSKLGPNQLVPRLDDPRFAVRDRAADALVRLGAEALPPLRRTVHQSHSVRQRREAVWTLARIDEPEARGPVRMALGDADATVRMAAAAAAGLYRDVDAQGRLRKMVVSDELPVRREAAAALARIRHPESVPSLLEGLSTGEGDRFYEHAVIHALIMIGDRKSTLPGLASPNPRVSHGALIALDQMDGGGLTPALVMPLLDGPDPEIHRTALQIIASRPAWADKAVGILRKMLVKDPADETHREELRQRLLAFSKAREIQDLMGEILIDRGTPAGIQVLLLETMARAPVSELPASWINALRGALGSPDEKVVRQAVATAHSRSILALREPLLALARDPKRAEDLRVEAIDTVAPQINQLDPPLFTLLLSTLRKDQLPLLRMSAARALGRAPLDESQVDALLAAVAEAGALSLPRLLPAFERQHGAKIGLGLIAALEQAPGIQSISALTLRRILGFYPTVVLQRADALLKRLTVDEQTKLSRLAGLESLLAEGDPNRGREAFFSTKAACSMCHTIGDQGGHVGPDLSRIGSIRAGRDLLEAILYPSASFARGFEPFIVATTDGQVHTGIIYRETAEAVFLVNGDRSERRLARTSIEAIEQGRTSVMPQGLDANLNRQELADIVSFLLSRL